ncbi:MAG: hypothetical protein J0653_04040, partial [Deltaproteobacteria bacterium]|nr:hypothetical protein [Deltaproteobacteria bacterium]
MTSTDGITWTSQTTTGSNQWQSVTYGNGKYVAVAQAGTNQAMTSPDGITWTNQTSPVGPWSSVTYGNGLYVAVGGFFNGSPVPKKVMTSADGVTWTARSSVDDGSWWRSVVYGNDMFVAVANYDTKLIMTSDCSPVLTVTTQDASTITTTTATGNGTILLTGLTDPTDRGIIIYPYTNTDKIIGGASVTNVHEAGTFDIGTYTASFTILTINTHYNVRTAYGDRVDFWTLANIPAAPTVGSPTGTTLNVTINVNENPATTQFAILDTVTDQYVQANGSFGADTLWQTSAVWGTKTVTGLTAGTEYTFKVKARNGSRVETVFGATANGTPLLLPLITTDAVSDITTITASGNGNITDIGVDNPTNRGIIWYPYTNTDKIIGETDVTNVSESGTYNTGTYFVSLTGLTLNSHYNA